MDPVVSATIGANIENNFYQWVTYPTGRYIPLEFTVPGDAPNSTVTHTCKLEVISTLAFETKDSLINQNGTSVNVTGPKGIILKDDAGNIYVHFNGTGDGKWSYNGAAYGTDISAVQEQSLQFFNDFIEQSYQGGNIYVSGHSQGGNTAQFVTVHSQYADYIDMCVSLDGPAMSNYAISRAKSQFGEAYFDRQCDKIYGFYGEHDYVSPLGQQHIIPEDQIFYVENTGDFHKIEGMLNGTSLNTLKTEDSAFRDLVIALNEKIKTLPQEDQEKAALLAMKFAEYFLGEGKNGPNLKPTLSEQDLEAFKALLFPLLVEFLEENPDMVYPALISIGMDEDTAKLIDQFLREFNRLPMDQRLELLRQLGKEVAITEDGALTLSPDVRAFLNALSLLHPTLLETLAKNPELVWSILRQHGVDTAILNFLEAHPFLSLGIMTIIGCIHQPLIRFFGSVTAFTYFIQGLYSICEKLENLTREAREFLRNTYQAILNTISKLKADLRSLMPGARYAGGNPYFRADPALLREYARRLSAVNSRLMSLDRDMNDLYWQVGLLDVLDLLHSDIITGYSVRIRLAQAYLNAAADALENADNQALRYMGG